MPNYCVRCTSDIDANIEKLTCAMCVEDMENARAKLKADNERLIADDIKLRDALHKITLMSGKAHFKVDKLNKTVSELKQKLSEAT